jgi:hypothetical protein
MKGSEEVLIPSGNFVPITLREGKSGHCALFTSLLDLLSRLGHGSTIKISVSGPLGVQITGPTH